MFPVHLFIGRDFIFVRVDCRFDFLYFDGKAKLCKLFKNNLLFFQLCFGTKANYLSSEEEVMNSAIKAIK